ncbi:DUF3309 family protein [Dyella japonica]|uniref:Tfp pilus assembly protein PilX n=2 Tax=Dyella TaxID=231454 RepID=A0ABV2K306_9GAMM
MRQRNLVIGFSDEALHMSLILLLIIVLLLLGALPTWPYSRAWGYGPSGGLGLILIILIVLLVLGVL